MGLGRCHFTSAIAVDCGGNPEWKARAGETRRLQRWGEGRQGKAG
jgi:hypothetical protein